ncbi:putative O-methyl transferase [Cercophora samala]|uniref:O-methyl transferase n=1 Tax=Cercophora samala TaxID=330535 RepID=A0AA39ZFB3_9PEZI|nr:putative O-methyl transferase [Cercophora samala]
MNPNNTPPPAKEPSTKSRNPPSSYYNAFTLSYYDLHVLGHNMTYIWRCPTRTVQLPLFQKHFWTTAASADKVPVGKRHGQGQCWEHLDIGAGTGYFVAEALQTCLEKVTPGSPPLRITLMDINSSSLTKAQRRIEGVVDRFRGGDMVKVRTVRHDVLDGDLLPEELGKGKGGGYDVVTMFNVLHCLRTTGEKKRGVFGLAAGLLREGGVLVGCTVLPGREYQPGGLGGWRVRYTLWLYNRVYKVFGNEGDTKGELEEGLRGAFEWVEVEVVGSVMTFVAWGPRRENSLMR